MIIRIPVPEHMMGRAGYTIEFDSDKIDVIQLTRGGPEKPVDRSSITLEFAAPEDAPRWVKPEGEADGT